MGWFQKLPIRRKLNWVILSICALVLLLTATAIAVYEVMAYRRALARDSTILADIVAANVSGTLAFDDEAAARVSLHALRSDPHVVAAALYAQNGTLFSRYERNGARYEFPSAPGANRAEYSGGSLTVVRPVKHNERQLGTIYVHIGLGDLRDRIVFFSAIVAATVLIAVLIAGALSSRLQRPITAPILELAETARRVSEQKDFSVRAATVGGGEIDTLTTAFNDMLGTIEEGRRALLGANARLTSEIGEREIAENRVRAHAARLGQLNQITRAIAERQDVESVFQTVTGSVEDQLPVDFACVCLYDEDREVLKVATIARGSVTLAEDLQLMPPAVISIDANSLGPCLRGELVYEPNTLVIAKPFPRRIGAAGLRSLVIAPLLVESRVFGVMIAARRAEAAFSSGDCEFLKQLSEHVALAANQSQLYAALQRAYDDLRQTQQAVMQQERLRALGQMASGIAHDINNAISPISLYIESMLEREPNLSAQARERLTIVQRAIDDVAHTVSRMREFYRQRPQDIALVRVRLNRLVEQVIDLTKARWFDMPQHRGIVIDLKRELTADLPFIKGVESEIREALTNLVFNAVDSMPRGGTLTLRSTMLSRSPDPGKREPEMRVALEVTDTGGGMSDETLRRCMEPFFTTKGERGSGLGLAMVYGMVKRHGGEIEINSAVGKGTTVRLLFPVAVGPEVFVDHEAQRPPGRLRLLIVDDDPMLIKSVSEILESDGHAVSTASGGQEGINAFIDAVNSTDPFQAVITDLGMPYVDGRRVATAVKAASPHTPVFLLTGWGTRLVAEGDIPPEVDRVLNKPPKLRELREALATVNGAAKA